MEYGSQYINVQMLTDENAAADIPVASPMDAVLRAINEEMKKASADVFQTGIVFSFMF